jgi:cytochrome P450
MTASVEPAAPLRTAPSSSGVPLLGALPQLSIEGAIPYYTRSWQQHGDVFRVQLGHRRAVVVVHPDAIAEVLVSGRENYVKGATYDHLRVLTGDGLLTLEGDDWRKRRRMAQPAFHRDSIRTLVERFVLVTREALTRLRERVPQGGVFEAHDEMTRLTLDIVGETLLGRRLGPSADSSAQAFNEAFTVLTRRSDIPFTVPRWLPTPGNRRLQRALRTLDDVVYPIIRDARARTTEGMPTLLSMLLEARDADTGEPLTDRELRDEILTLVLAGHETTALLLTWGFTLLGRAPEVVARMRSEVADVMGDREPRADDLPRLTYLKQTIEEILRIRPPAWIFGRDVLSDGNLCGYRVHAGELVMPIPYLTHRHPQFWDDPERFDPTRFDPERVKERPNWAYCPFSAGPRSCIGNLFTMAEAQVILAMFLQQADFELASHAPVPLRPLITLRPGGPVDVRVRWRTRASA